LRDVPSDRVNDAIAHGGHVAVWKKDRKGKWCLMGALPDGTRLDECASK
jgi:putative hemolysin